MTIELYVCAILIIIFGIVGLMLLEENSDEDKKMARFYLILSAVILGLTIWRFDSLSGQKIPEPPMKDNESVSKKYEVLETEEGNSYNYLIIRDKSTNVRSLFKIKEVQWK